MQNAIKKLILTLISTDSSISISQLNGYINTSEDIIEGYISELIAEGLIEYVKNTDSLYINDEGLAIVQEVRTLGQSLDNCKLRPFVGNRNKSGYPIINTPSELAQFLNCIVSIIREYHSFNISKGHKKRLINAPSLSLKQKQRWILDNILSCFLLDDSVHGFVPHKSIKTNALCHINKRFVVCMDLKDFFPSVTENMVAKIYKEMGYPQSVVVFLTRLSTYNGVLPQGAPTSPMLANIAFHKVDILIAEYANKNGLVYSRYAD